MVKRWSCELSENEKSAYMGPYDNGDYVLFSDYSDMEYELSETIFDLRRKLEEIERVLLGGR
jgi:hypothetical protein